MRVPHTRIAKARHLRRTLSPPEARLWTKLRERAPGRPVFRRQHPIGPYVLDFYCAKARSAIEIDGESHEFADRPQRDERRDAWLKGNGVTVVHVPAAELQYQVEEIADWIMRLALEAQSK
ncbi:MAG: endonuclease domain-containing protein [Xanthobacteraceae bacterium]